MSGYPPGSGEQQYQQHFDQQQTFQQSHSSPYSSPHQSPPPQSPPHSYQSPTSPPQSTAAPTYSDAPEVVPPSEPEWVHGGPQSGPPHAGYNDQYAQAAPIPVLGEDVQAKKEDPHPFAGVANEPDQSTPGAARPWWKRKLIIGIIVGAIVVVALAVGLGVGLTVGQNDSDDNSSNGDGSSGDGSTTHKKPDCKGTLCQHIIAMPVYQGAMFVMGRTNDDTLAYRSFNGSWSKWVDIGETTGKLISQPEAIGWDVYKDFQRLDVAAISSSEHAGYNKWMSEKEGWTPDPGTTWFELGTGAGSAIKSCKPISQGDRIDWWVTDQDTGNIMHTYWAADAEDDLNSEAKKGDTSQMGAFFGHFDSQNLKPKAKGAPGVVCRDSTTYHDLVWYATDEDAMYHASFNDDDDWQTSSAFNGKWIGNPGLVTPIDNPERWDFFGVQDDNKVYHMSWESGSDKGYSDMKGLGGDIISSVAYMSSDSGVMDIVALGSGGTLQHQHYDGTSWADDWEDLGVYAHSAPSIGYVKGGNGNAVTKIYMGAVSQEGHLMVWTKDASVKKKWKDELKEEDLGGDMTLDFYMADS